MPAYMIFIRESEIRDPEAMARYQGGNRSGGPSHGIRPLAVYGKQEAIEGTAPDGVVLLEFPDMDSAKAWYNSPEYQARVPDRLQAADYRCVLVEGWTPPAA
jgi:uncharacterized protein (DUF1330 family)